MLVFFSPLWLLWQKHMGQHIITVDKRNTIFCNKDCGINVCFNLRKVEYMWKSCQVISLFATAAMPLKLILPESNIFVFLNYKSGKRFLNLP